MGAVYRARRADLGREFALKVMLRPDSPGAVERFLREAKAAAALAGHPGIVAVHDIGEADDGSLYLAMDLVRGVPLDRAIDETELSPREWARTVGQAAEAIHFAHLHGVLHRDLKPANIIVDGESGRARVMDFGLATRAEDTRLTKSGEVLGTPAYMPPEQAAGDPLDERADVWSLGATLYECLAGRPPFDGATALNVLAAVMTKDPRRIVGAPRDLEAIVMRCLEKDRDRRYPSALALAQDLGRFVGGEPVAAKPIGPAARLARRVRRRPLPWAAGAAAAAVAAGAGLWTWHQGAQRQTAVQALQIEAEAAAARFRGLGDGAEIWEAERAYGAAVAAGEAAGRLDAEAQAACGRLLAGLAAARLAAAERGLDRDAAARFLGDLRQHGAGTHGELIQGDGVIIAPASEPAGAAVEVLRYADRGGRLVAESITELAAGEEWAAPMGSYLLVLRRDGYADVRLPVLVERGEREAPGPVRMLTADEIGEGFVYVPAGESVFGGDRDAPGAWPLRRETVPGFLLGRGEVTLGEYQDFYRTLHAAGDAEGLRDCAPVLSERHGAALVVRGGAVELASPRLPLDLPVMGVSADAAERYCAWRSERDGRRVRLPTEAEWERAARGADGRPYPWGAAFSHESAQTGVDPDTGDPRQPWTVTAGGGAWDESPFGVRGLCGGVSEHCAPDGAGQFTRGGSWGWWRPYDFRSATRIQVVARHKLNTTGFRLAADLP